MNLQLQHISIGYKQPLLQNVSVSFSPGKLVGLIGNNGCGKTTLLKTICKIIPALSGEIFLNKKNLQIIPSHELAKIVTLSFAFNASSFPLSVYELIATGRYPYLNNMAAISDADHKIISECISQMEISKLQNHPITSISEGERQKAFIAKALAQQTPVLLLDEPTAFLDYSSKKKFFRLIKEITAGRKLITIISSHDVDFLVRHADELCMIQDNSEFMSGTTADLAGSLYFKNNFSH